MNDYNKYYQSIGFERRGLFELIKKNYNPKTVLYPGASVHITPSFYFPHIVYIDKSPVAARFFDDREYVNRLINSEKKYREKAYWSFINADFTNIRGLRESSFDLLISLFSGKMTEYCLKYLKAGGLILSNSLFSDNESLKNNLDLTLTAVIQRQNKKYKILTNDENIKPKASQLKASGKGFGYRDNEIYYLYRKKK